MGPKDDRRSATNANAPSAADAWAKWAWVGHGKATRPPTGGS